MKQNKVNKLTDMDIMRVSLVDNPAVPDATFKIIKSVVDLKEHDMNTDEIMAKLDSLSKEFKELKDSVEKEADQETHETKDEDFGLEETISDIVQSANSLLENEALTEQEYIDVITNVQTILSEAYNE